MGKVTIYEDVECYLQDLGGKIVENVSEIRWDCPCEGKVTLINITGGSVVLPNNVVIKEEK